MGEGDGEKVTEGYFDIRELI